MRSFLSICIALFLATPAAAEFTRITERADFVAAVEGKRLTRALVSLRVTGGGAISGRGGVWDVTGNWDWQGGYFCRSLIWGGDDLGYNCQEVTRDGNTLRFTSDKGAGQSATFTLR